MANTLNLGDGNWATKKDSLLGYNSENNNYKPLPFDFSRASSATVINKQGLIETVGSGEPRVDYKDDSKGALLLEPSRSNFYTQSNLFTFGGNVTSNNALSPDGSLNASKITKTSSSDQYVTLSWSASLSTSTTYSLSFFVKHNGDDVDLRYETNNFNDWGVSWNALFEVRENSVIASTVNNCTSNVINFGNGWYRVVVFVTTSSSITPTSPSNLIRVIGSDTKQFLMYGAMFEQGSYPTSYIPTQGSAVTRIVETCNGAGNTSTFNDSQGVLYAEVKGFEEVPSDSGYITISSPSVSFTNAAVLQFRNNGDLRFYFGGSASGNIQFIDSSIDFTENNKIAVQYDSNGSNYKMFVNGVSISRYSLATNQSVTGLSELNLNYSVLELFGEVKDVRVYNNSLTDAQLQALTQ